LNEEQKQANRTKSKVRARVEHVFARSGCDGRSSGAHHQPAAGKGEDWPDEFGLKHDAPGTTRQARRKGSQLDFEGNHREGVPLEA